jgi:DNA-binding CsgD family transcriptional regulator
VPHDWSVPDHDAVPAGPVRLIGRDDDLRLVRSFAAAPATRFLLVHGSTGLGKTSLLDEAARTGRSAGCAVLRAAGVQFAETVSFGGLHQLLQPLQDRTGQLSDSHRRAVSVALGQAEGPAADRLVLASAVLSLLHLAAAERPVLLAVDDLHWLDRASALTFGLVARRLTGTRIGLLAASRWSADSHAEVTGLPDHELDPLSDQAAADLLDDRFSELAPQVRRRVLAEAAGNPMALLELPAALTRSQRTGADALPAFLPLGRRIQLLYVPRIAALPGPTRQALLLAALEETGELAVIERLLRESGEVPGGLGDLVPAERDELVRIDEAVGRLVFRHPLVRSIAVELSTSDDRRRAHRVLAAVLTDQPDRRAWHLAAAAGEPDEEVACLLASEAHRTLQRGDPVGAVAALTRAADLSPRALDRATRLAEAAYIAGDVTGELRRAPELLAAATRADPRPSGSLRAAVAASFVLLNDDGDVTTAHRLLVGAIETGEHGYDAGDDGLIEALWTLLMVCWFGGGVELWAPFHQAVARLKPRAPQFLSLCARTFADPAWAGAAAVPELIAAMADLHTETDPVVIVRIGIAAAYAERLTDCREALWRVIRHGRQGGAVTSAIYALLLMGADDVRTGLWDEADALIGEGLALCEAHGYKLLTWPARYGQALLAAARGDEDANRALTSQMMRWSVPRGVRAIQEYALHARALAALGRGDFEDAYRQAAAISPPGVLASHAPNALWAALDLAEACARSGRVDDAAAHAAVLREAGAAELSPRFAATERAAAALGATGERAATLFEEALAVPGGERWAFDRARIQLLFGERLRRDQALTRARGHLTAALGTFSDLGARPWAARAASELRATGLPGQRASDVPATGVGGRGALTAREREIASLAAGGLSNKQIAERLFLSARTVSDHLHKIFPKLGIASRAALRDALGDVDRSADFR